MMKIRKKIGVINTSIEEKTIESENEVTAELKRDAEEELEEVIRDIGITEEKLKKLKNKRKRLEIFINL